MSGHRTVAFILGVALGSALLAQNALAAVNYYLQIDGIKGESKDDQHKDSIEIQDFSFSVESPRDASSGMATGRRQHKAIVIRKVVDSASPLLMQACASGKHFPIAVLEEVSSNGRKTVITLRDILVSSASGMPDRGGSGRMETITLEYESSSIQYANSAGGDMQRMQTAPMMPQQVTAPLPH
jgi:type VI secretion system secreted protein Hcp